MGTCPHYTSIFGSLPVSWGPLPSSQTSGAPGSSHVPLGTLRPSLPRPLLSPGLQSLEPPNSQCRPRALVRPSPARTGLLPVRRSFTGPFLRDPWLDMAPVSCGGPEGAVGPGRSRGVECWVRPGTMNAGSGARSGEKRRPGCPERRHERGTRRRALRESEGGDTRPGEEPEGRGAGRERGECGPHGGLCWRNGV